MDNEMEPKLTRCGYRCDLCLAYRPNVEAHPANQGKLSDGWFSYFGFRIEPADIVCDGCMSERPILIDKHCPVRRCVIDRKLDNCSSCCEYVCDKLVERIVEFNNIQNRIDREIPDDDYVCFIRPYENKRRLEIYVATGEVVE